MLVGEIRSQIDSIWNDFWSGGVSNPLSVIEQITYLLFIKRLDELQSVEEHKANTLRAPLERRIFPEGADPRGEPYENLRWSRFRDKEPREMFRIVEEHVFPFIRERVAAEGSLARSMRDARFQIPTPALLAKAVDKLDHVRMGDRDTKGDVYEYMLGKIASAGQNGQFRTPRHIIALMTALMAPTPKDVICDPAAGTCGFLVAASEYLREHHAGLFRDDAQRRHFHEQAFHGFDFDPTMLRIGAMNMILHGVENPVIEYRDSLSEDIAGEKERYSLILANPPFAGSLDYEQTARDLQQVVKTKKTELLFLALFLRLLRTGGRAAVIVPDGVLFGSSKAHKELRRMLVEDHKLDAVISLPSGVFRPYAGVSTAILCFTKTGVGGTDHVWFYDMKADGLSLDDKRQELLPAEKLGPTPDADLTEAEHEKNNLPDILKRWMERDGAERERPRTAQSFCVPKKDIVHDGAYDLSINRYRQTLRVVVGDIGPAEIVETLKSLRDEIAEEFKNIERTATVAPSRRGWRRLRLDEVTECLDRLRKPVKESDRIPGTVPYYGANGQQGWIDRPIFNEDLVLVAEDGGFFDQPWRGVSYKISGPSWVNNHAHILRPIRSIIDVNYLHHALRNFDFTKYISGTTRSKLTQAQLNSTIILVPPIEEQVIIANEFDRIDALKMKLKSSLLVANTLDAAIQRQFFDYNDDLASPKT
ncbi:type I restriction enzyme M protein [Stella humosa]|uniref:site-specific DNA-methyltransferase (adenine-specific) n=1 Tax=Stella humosa TaxID=94 RepID=A0A3N1L027_9PROT|nr:N-6 DNA methylase [Stella humosa]ROP84389.1 type I restriction enzyme M protein [Stella humosa]BBK33905.1 hypothetical protein STHU_45390 [Stella humosa]